MIYGIAYAILIVSEIIFQTFNFYFSSLIFFTQSINRILG